jgi:hypothetical protein
MSLVVEFSERYSKWYYNLKDSELEARVSFWRNNLQSKDIEIKKSQEEELDKKRPQSKDSLETCITAFLKFDSYARSFFNGGTLNQLGKNQQHNFLKNFIHEYSNVNINFPKSNQQNKKPLYVKGKKIHYVIMNAMNNYDNNFVAEWGKGKNTPTILILGGKTSINTYNELKNKKINNVEVFNIDEFIEWVKQN